MPNKKIFLNKYILHLFHGFHLFVSIYFNPIFSNFIQIAQASAVADEAIGNIKTVRSFAMEDAEKK